MKKTIAISAVMLFALTACNKPEEINPSPTRTAQPTVTQTTNEPGPTEVPTTSVPDPGAEPTTNKPEEPVTPAPSVISSDAGTPATQFAQRWGVRYPSVPEYAILKAANGVCAMIEQFGNGWESDERALAGIREAAEFAGIAGYDGLEFAQDANQNYCSTVSNPT